MATLSNEWVDLTMVSDSAIANGSTTDYVTTQNIKSIVGTTVTLNGLDRKITSDYTINLSTNTISFVSAPALGTTIKIKYFKRS